ncbi:GTPase ObgE [Simkania sp.]|uniref:GTPase ObgE n=1 Tax=Simkania sp. TaxID=34094 RepID=UPI003B5218A4
MFTDHVRLKLIAGKGGNGTIAWRREKYIPKGGPYGGNGGRGASITIMADPEIYSLDTFRNQSQIRAPNGKQGGTNNRQGASGKDLILKVPCGTLLRDANTKTLLYDFTEPGETFQVCEGGKGGKGNTFFKTSTHQAPAKCTPGLAGEIKEVELELKLIADVGFVGFPNAGKSTLLTKLASIDVKTAPYPFTTLRPNISYIEFDDFSRIYLADIPGIINDAHSDRGLGLAFLRHIERSSTLVYVIDTAAVDGRDPYEDFLTLRKELEHYSPQILQKPFIVALNKVDCEEAQEHLEAFKEKYPFGPETLFEISAKEATGIPPLIEKIRTLAQADGKRFV